MLGGKIIERQQCVAIFLEAGNSFVVFDAIKLDETIECGLGILARLGHPDVLQGHRQVNETALVQITKNKNVEGRKPLIFHNWNLDLCLGNATLHQSLYRQP
jgi:hypothetical protein